MIERSRETSYIGNLAMDKLSSFSAPENPVTLSRQQGERRHRMGPMLRVRNRDQDAQLRRLQSAVITAEDLPMEGLISTTREQGGYTTMYSCTSEETQELVKETRLFFDFEFVLPNPEEPLIEVVTQDFPKVELGILFRMAQVCGIYPDCDLITKQLSDPWETLTDTLTAGTETAKWDRAQFLSERNLIMGLSSWSPDQVDEIGECEFIKEVDEGLICVPVVGDMTVYYVGDDEKAIIDYLNYHLREEMNDQKVSLGGPGGVKETYFIGTRERGAKAAHPPATADTNPITRDPNAGKMRILPIVLAVGFGCLVILLGLLFVTRRRRNEQEDNEEAVSAEPDISVTTEQPENERETGKGDGKRGDIIAAPMVKTLSSESSDEAEEEESADTHDDVPREVTMEISNEEPSNSPLETISSVNTQPAKSDTPEPDVPEELPSYLPSTISTTSSDVESVDTNMTAVTPPLPPIKTTPTRSSGPVSVDILPPLPPGGPSAKTAAVVVPPPNSGNRKRRKKKKKKKRNSLERVNSRDSINEMETIQEGQEDNDGESEGESSYGSGSEYSWSTDDTDSRAGSRDPSPVRSLTNESAVTELINNTAGTKQPPAWV